MKNLQLASNNEIYNRPPLDAQCQDLAEIVPLAWHVQCKANNPERLFIYGDNIVRVQSSDQSAKIEMVTADILRYESGMAADWRGVRGKEEKPALPPMSIVRAMLATPLDKINLPLLEGVTYCPVFTEEGTLENTPGYCSGSRFFYIGKGVKGIPETVTHKDIIFAKKAILYPFQDFNFKFEADRTNAIAFMFTPFVLPMISSNIPAQLITSPVHGAGKGLHNDVVTTPGMGPHKKVTPLPKDEAEDSKKITSLLLEGTPGIVFDNINRPLDSAPLAALLTTRTWTERILGKSETRTIPNNSILFFTANNPELSGEMTRRCVLTVIIPETDRPWLRDNFAIENMREYLMHHRSSLQRAIITIIKGWLQEGRPKGNVKPLGSFEEWSVLLGSIMEYAGFKDFLGNQLTFYDEGDCEGSAWRELCTLWWDRYNGSTVKTSDLWNIAQDVDGLPLNAATDQGKRVSFGKLLTKQKDRIFDNFQVKSAGRYKNKPVWKLIKGNQQEGNDENFIPFQ